MPCAQPMAPPPDSPSAAEHVDVGLKKPTIWSLDLFDLEDLFGEIKLQKVILSRRAVRTPDDIEALPSACPTKILQRPKRGCDCGRLCLK